MFIMMIPQNIIEDKTDVNLNCISTSPFPTRKFIRYKGFCVIIIPFLCVINMQWLLKYSIYGIGYGTLYNIKINVSTPHYYNILSHLPPCKLTYKNNWFSWFAAYHLYSNSTEREVDKILSVKYEDGRWSKPYYDCGGGNIWMLTYTVPFFGHDNGTYFFK